MAQSVFTVTVGKRKPSKPRGLLRTNLALRGIFRKSPGMVRYRAPNRPYSAPVSRIAARKWAKGRLKRTPAGGQLIFRLGDGTRVVVKAVAPAAVYRDPFRDAVYTAARIDAGVDYCYAGGSGKVYAIGPGVIVNVGTPSHTSTFGSDMSVYRLTAGPAKGKCVFFAEHYNNVGSHKAGDHIDANTVLYMMNGGCIEIGWSDGRGSMAWNSGNYSEGQLSALGANFSNLLGALGSKPGLTLGRSVTGTLPAGFPKTWKGLV